MLGFSFSRRHRRRVVVAGSSASQGKSPGWDSGRGDGRYVSIPGIDVQRAVPFGMTPPPERDTVLRTVDQLTKDLEGAIDEGTGASLDRLIESWTGSWIATVESEYVDHCAEISVHRGQARQWMTEASVIAEQEREKRDEIRSDLRASRHRLTGESSDPAPSAAADSQDTGNGSGPTGSTAAGTGHSDRPDWSAPHLVAGRSILFLLIGAVLILIGALADTIAFHNTLELVLSTEQTSAAWELAGGTTCMALVSAASLGGARAVHHRGKYLPPRHRPSRLPLRLASVVWIALGLAMFVIRWLGQNSNNNFTLSLTNSSTSGPSHYTLWQAIFFAAIYFISGTCTLLESERLYNPEYFAFRRLSNQDQKQSKKVATSEAAKDRAEGALEQHDGELQREDQRRNAAIADRQALGAEAANYARVRMAAMMRDPSKTGITETGPVPDMSASFGTPVGAAAGAASAGPGGGSGQPAGGGASGP